MLMNKGCKHGVEFNVVDHSIDRFWSLALIKYNSSTFVLSYNSTQKYPLLFRGSVLFPKYRLKIRYQFFM